LNIFERQQILLFNKVFNKLQSILSNHGRVI
jgi:hypothetical protein